MSRFDSISIVKALCVDKIFSSYTQKKKKNHYSKNFEF